jgi:hypothetical protein
VYWGALLILILCCGTVSAAENIRTGLTINPNIATTTISQTQQTITCSAPCECLLPSEASSKWSVTGYSQCSATPCGYSGGLASAPVAKYCYKQKTVSIISIPTTTLTQISAQLPTCGTGLTFCAGKGCVDLKTDSKNCGGCGQGCTVGKVCTNGICTVPIKELTTTDPCLLQGRVSCNGVCVDIHGSDSNNCGGCGWQCPSGLSCSGGECVMECPAGLEVCQYDCVDILNDEENCGECGHACSPKQACDKGQCMSLCNFKPSDFQSFSWADWQGVNWMTVPKNQGNCGSCWAEAPTGAVEAVRNIENGGKIDIDLSEQWYTSACAGDFGSCLGGNNGAVLDNLKSTGVPEEDVLPWQSVSCGYHADPPNSKNYVCNADCNGGNPAVHCSTPTVCKPSILSPDKLWKIKTYYAISADNAYTYSDAVEKIQKAILCYGPLSACSGHWWHCVDIVGWQGTPWSGNGGWIIRNSWGATWNGNGYALVPYGDPWSNNDNDHSDLIRDTKAVMGVYSSGP